MELIRVNEPKYQTLTEIAKEYWNNWLLISNFTPEPKGGIVRYYYPTREKTLTSLIMEMDKDEATYGECLLAYVGEGQTLGGLRI